MSHTTHIRAVEVIQVPSIVRNKLGAGASIPMRLDPRVLTKLESAIKELELGYGSTLKKQIAAMLLLMNSVEDGRDDLKSAIATIYQMAHEIRGVAGTFKRPVTNRIAGNLCSYIDELGDTLADKTITRFHIEALFAASSATPEPADEVAMSTVETLERMTRTALTALRKDQV